MTAAFQDAFGQLLLDEHARERFLASPNAYAQAFDDATAALLGALDPDDVLASAENLIDKRRGHVRELCPALAEALGAAFKPRFRAHALSWLIAGAEKHRADALRFALDCVRDGEPAVRSAAADALGWLHAGVRLRTARGGALPTLSLQRVPLTVRVTQGLVVGGQGRLWWRWRRR